MNPTAHTPAPWTGHHKNGEIGIVADEQGQTVCTVHFHPHAKDEAHANIDLIAAAPELLAACKVILAACNCNYDPQAILSEYGSQARAAISKAEAQP